MADTILVVVEQREGKLNRVSWETLTGAQAIAAEYKGAGAERLLVLAGETETVAWRGTALAEGEYDVLPGDGGSSSD